MHELIVNLHMHTTYSDGSGTHADLAQSALQAGVDVLLVTDHNTMVKGVDAYVRNGKKRVLLLTGEEIHDQARDPQKNHLLVFNVDQDFATLADDPQVLINSIRDAGGLSFIAHPIDPPLASFGEDDISWVDWGVQGYTGIELWNGFSELKSVVKSKLDGIFYAFFPRALARGPLPQTLAIWDGLLNKGQKVVAIGGSDAHALHLSMGPLHRVVFPYEYHFSTVNTHIMVPNPLLGNIAEDKMMIYSALAAGHCFLGYDLPLPTRAFRFSASNGLQSIIMGDEMLAKGGVTIQVKFPSQPTEAFLIKDGSRILNINQAALTYPTDEPGTYRVEAYINYLGRKRGWIFSNPIYLR